MPDRETEFDASVNLGHAVYCIGLTGDFRKRPLDTISAHAAKHARMLYGARFESWLYLSSARIYGRLGIDGVGTETSPIPVTPSADSLYDLSKLLGEATCLGHPNPTVRVARLSNVYGPGQSEATFLGAVMSEMRRLGKVNIHESPQSSKDYVSVHDVVTLLAQIATAGRQRLYNIASGRPTSHQEIADRLTALTSCPVGFSPDASTRAFPRIDIRRVQDEFLFEPRNVLDALQALLHESAAANQKGS